MIKYPGLHVRFETNFETAHTQNSTISKNQKERYIPGIESRLLIYKVIIKPIMTYNIQLRSIAAKSYIVKIDAMPSIIVRTTVDAS